VRHEIQDKEPLLPVDELEEIIPSPSPRRVHIVVQLPSEGALSIPFSLFLHTDRMNMFIYRRTSSRRTSPPSYSKTAKRKWSSF
jgi:hypothetical protein